ncbi:hypothetical protein BJA01nite_35190 [Bradyrhizobium japonicum]|nr:hypothetical protein BJ6T_19120 [Bradyrhizobium japonicum USDA 6]GEC45877.1 hypothetical protein BJA01nite_35190 [Bradyrhizobium japonicum]
MIEAENGSVAAVMVVPHANEKWSEPSGAPAGPNLGLKFSGNDDWKRETNEMARPAPITIAA